MGGGLRYIRISNQPTRSIEATDDRQMTGDWFRKNKI